MTPARAPATAIPPERMRSRRPGSRLLVLLVLIAIVGLALSGATALRWRAGASREQRQSFATTAADITLSLGTLLRRDVDFVTTLRGVMTMEPSLSASGFERWYAAVGGRQRQVGAFGTAVVTVVRAQDLRSFVARRDADPAFRRLVGGGLPVPLRAHTTEYCLLSAGGQLGPTPRAFTAIVQEDWCDPAGLVGTIEAPLLHEAAATGTVVAMRVGAPVRAGFLEAAFYSRARPTGARTTAGWVLSSFDLPAMIASAIGHRSGIGVSVYHRNPGAARALLGAATPGGHPGVLTRTTRLAIGGNWIVTVSGAPSGLDPALQGWLVLAAGGLITLCVLVIVLVFARAREGALRLVAEKTSELRHQVLHDPLTTLLNRRALLHDLERELAESGDGLTLALFDLDGFKEYNDIFGHLAGDALLERFGGRLAGAVDGFGYAYRMGGDEFCVLARADERAGAELAVRASGALTEIGEGYRVTCTHGLAYLPREAATAVAALRLADARMYGAKTARVSAGRQSADVLLGALGERSPDLGEHVCEVSTLAMMAAQKLGLDKSEVRIIGLAAELHDVGKLAIPDSILNKPGPLDEQEWEIMRLHTEIGERIILAAPALNPAAPLVRASHERFDGGGYPDGLRGEEIPLGASIIAVCDAFDAMTSKRVYCDPIDTWTALERLRDCAGTQFHPDVVVVVCELVEQMASTVSRLARRVAT